MKEIKDIWNDKLKSSLDRVGSINSWLLLLNLAVVCLFAQQYFVLRESKQQIKYYDTVLSKPWQGVKFLYEGTNGFLEKYTEEEAMPWYQLCLLSSAEAIKLKHALPKEDRNNPTLNATINQISYAARALSYYNADLRRVAIAQKNLKSFEQLDRQSLISLMRMFVFKATTKSDSLKLGLEKAQDNAIYFLSAIDNLEKSGKESDLTERGIRNLQFARTKDPFFDIAHEMLMRDMRGFGDNRIGDKELLRLISYITKNTAFTNLDDIQKTHETIKGQIKDVESKQAIEIPFSGIKVSLWEFTVLSWIINCLIIVYLWNALNGVKDYWAKYSEPITEPDDNKDFKKALFHDWAFGLNPAKFKIIYSMHLSCLSIICPLFGWLMFGNIPLRYLLLLPAIITWFFALQTAKKYLSIGK